MRGASLSVGYFRRPDLFAAAHTPDGWFDTGDLARIDDDGYIRITGRTKDLVIRGGENIPVVEIEGALFAHPDVAEIAVVGYPDDRLGERCCAVVVPSDATAPPTLEALTTHLQAIGVAKTFWPERLEVRAVLPKTASGKVQKFVLREEFALSASN
jgi:cyclohexanecarboxylate-CoA ligase